MPILRNARAVEQAFLIENLKPVLFLEDDPIILEGELGDQVFFVHKGCAKVYLTKSVKGIPDPSLTESRGLSRSVYENDPNFEGVNKKNLGTSFVGLDDNNQPAPKALVTKAQKCVNTFEDGAIFGEIALLTNLKRTSTVKVYSSELKCAYLTRKDVKALEKYFPHIVQ